MITGDSRQQVIPPTRTNVKAGFVVYTPNKDERSIIILNEGELAAIDNSGGDRKIVFRMHPGDLVGVASLLEREPFHLTIEAFKDSNITLVNEDCMESELKTLPVWLLAVIKTLSSKTRKLKSSLYTPLASNTLASLAEYCSKQPEHTDIVFSDLVQEFGWLTKIKEKEIQEDLKALARRRFIELKKVYDDVIIVIQDSFLLKLFVDYQRSQQRNETWGPFKLSVMQKKVLVTLSAIDEHTEMDGPAWLSSLSNKISEFNVAEWIKIQKLGWFKATAKETFLVNTSMINYYLTALRYETNIKGVL